MEALGINIGYLLMQIAGLTILIILLNHFAYGPILTVLEERKERIAKGLEDARQAAIARDNADADAKKIMDEARAEAAKVREEAVKQAEGAAAGVVAEANAEAKKIVASAHAEGESDRNKILAELRGQVAAISVAAANKIVGASLDDARQRELISDFFAQVPEGLGSGDSAEVVSALPLTDAEAAKVKSAVSANDVSFKVDPTILGGLIVRIGDQVVDNSVASKMAGLGASLK